MAAASNVIYFGLLYMRPLQWWLRTKGFSQKGNPFRMFKVTRRCLRALVMWQKLWFLSQGPVLGASCRRKMLTTDASLTGWGATLEGRSSQGLWKDHHLSWHINHLEMFAVFLALKNFLADLRAHHLLICSDNTSPGGFTVTSTLQTGVPNSPVVPREVAVSSSSLHPGGPQCRSRHPVETGAETRGMEAPPRGGGADMEGLRPGTSGSVCVSRDVSLSTLVFPHASSSSRTGRNGTDMAEASSVMLFPRSLCSREYWREIAGTGFYYFSLPRGGRAEYGSQI